MKSVKLKLIGLKKLGYIEVLPRVYLRNTVYIHSINFIQKNYFFLIMFLI